MRTAPNPVDYPSTEGAERAFGVYEFWRREARVYRIPDRSNAFVVSRYVPEAG
jgi:hypothetical protein